MPRYKFLIKPALTVLISVLIIFAIVKAGTITPPSGTPAAQFYTLSEIYTRLTTNATTTEGGHDFTFADSLIGAGRTLTEIYNTIPTIIANTVKLGTSYLGVSGTLVPSGGTATTTDVLSGKTFFGDSQTDWILQTGTMADNGVFGLTASSTNQSVTAGYYSGGTLAGDADLATGNIKKDINIFGIIGALIPSGGTATVANVATGATFFGASQTDWTLQTGTFDPYTPQKFQTKDDWVDSGGTTGEYTGEEATWTTVSGSPFAGYNTIDFSIGGTPVDLYSGIVKQDTRTGLWFSDIMAVDGGGTATTSSNSFTLSADGSRPTGGNAIGFCDALNTASFGGYADWYLPTQKQLQQAYIDGSANNLPNPAHSFWSATERSTNAAYAWNVYLSSGITDYLTKVTNYSVRCVRP